jgi:hypothetical protein
MGCQSSREFVEQHPFPGQSGRKSKVAAIRAVIALERPTASPAVPRGRHKVRVVPSAVGQIAMPALGSPAQGVYA